MSDTAFLLSFLSGCTEGATFDDAATARDAVQHLMSCEEHNGSHHFAVVEQGRTVLMSPTAVACLRKAATHRYVESGSGFCAVCDDMPGEGEHKDMGATS